MPKVYESLQPEMWLKGEWRSGNDRGCLGWWISRAYGAQEYDDSIRRLIDVILMLYPKRARAACDLRNIFVVTLFNDHWKTTFVDVQRVLKVADL